MTISASRVRVKEADFILILEVVGIVTLARRRAWIMSANGTTPLL